MATATSYAKRVEALSGKSAGSGLNQKLVMAADGSKPDGVQCLDYHAKCSDWASQVSTPSSQHLLQPLGRA